MYFPRTYLTDTMEKVKNLFEEFDLVARVKNSADSAYWFVKICDNNTLNWIEFKRRLLKIM